MMDLDLQGKIDKFTLAEILQLIAAGRKTGTLGIQREDSIVMIYFEQGDIIYAYGPRQTFHLGRLLRDRKIISSEQLEDAVNTQARTENSKRLGEILIQKKYIDRADLQTVIITQIGELVYSLLSWQSGSFKFYEDQFPTDEEIRVRLSVENVILEGLRRIDEENMVAEALPDIDQTYIISATQGERRRSVNMAADEWNIMALVNGSNSLEDICRLSGGDSDITMKRLARLKLAGLITPIEKKKLPESTGELETMVAGLSKLFESYLTERTSSRLSGQQLTTKMVGEDN